MKIAGINCVLTNFCCFFVIRLFGETDDIIYDVCIDKSNRAAMRLYTDRRENARMKHRRKIAIVLSLCMLGVSLPQNTAHSEVAVKVKKITLNKSFQVIKKGGKVKLKATFSPKKAKTKITWKSSNKKVATVSSSGVVKGRKKGKATITAKAMGKKATCRIQVGIPVKKITVSKQTISLKAGQTASVKGSVLPKNASVKKITYTTDNKKVATVTKAGVVRAVSAGTTKVQLKSTDGNGAKQTVVVKVTSTASSQMSPSPSVPSAPDASPAKTAKPTSPVASGSPSPDTSKKPEPSGAISSEEPDDTPEPIRYTENEEDFADALDDDSLRELHFASSEEVSLTVPDGDYSNVTIFIDAPNAEVNIEGKVQKVCLENKSEVSNSRLTLYTNQRLIIENSVPFRLFVRCGGELSRVFSKQTTDCPEIYGVGNIYQQIEQTGTETYVPACSTEEEMDETNVSVSGRVCSAISRQTVAGASVLCVPYSGEYTVGETLTEAQIQKMEDVPESILMPVDENGVYADDAFLQGNYFVVVRAGGYKTVTGIMSVTSQYGDSFVYDTISLVPETDIVQTGTVSGRIISATDKTAVTKIKLVLREGLGNQNGRVAFTVRPNTDGSYHLSDVPYGNYTAQIVSDSLKDGYALSSVNLTVASASQSFNLYASERLKKENQLRFAASWIGEIQNVNLHLTGMGVQEGEYHVWRDDAAIYEQGKLSMKMDVKTEEAPQIETATVYQPAQGDYALTVCAVDDKNSAAALAQSGMRVVVYLGDIVAMVLNVPCEEGNTWNVLSYDGVQELLLADGSMNTIESEQEKFEAYGQSYRGSIFSLLTECQSYKKNLTGNVEGIEAKLQSLQQLLNTVFDEGQYCAEYESAATWFEELREEFSVSVAGDDVEETVYDWKSNDVIVYTTRQGVAKDELEIEFDNGVAVEKPELCEDGAMTAYQVTADSGISRLFQIYLKTKLEYIVPISATIRGGDVPFYLSEGYHTDYDAIYLYDEFTLNQVDVNFGATGADSVTLETDEKGNSFVVVSLDGQQRRWLLISMVMPAITGNSMGKIYRTSYVEDSQVYVYGEALPVAVANHYTFSALPTGYSYENYYEDDFDAENDTALKIHVVIHKDDGTEADREVEITYMSVDTCCDVENIFLMGADGDVVIGEVDEEHPNFLLFAVEGEARWETLKVIFVDSGVTSTVNTDIGVGYSYQAELIANFYGYKKTYYLKIE